VSHGEALRTSTHLGNPLGCAAGLAVLAALEGEALVRRADELGARSLARLGQRLPGQPPVGPVLVRGRPVPGAREGPAPRPGPAHPAAPRVHRRKLCRAAWIALGEGPDQRPRALAPPLVISEELLDAAADLIAELAQ